MGQACNTSLQGQCSQGSLQCIDGQEACQPLLKPGQQSEVCDGVDNDCDGLIDEEALDGTLYYRDLDGDGHGDATQPLKACSPPMGYVLSSDDCYDHNANAFPGQSLSFWVERGDGLFDYDCDGAQVPEYTEMYSCKPSFSSVEIHNGWQGSTLPACGESRSYYNGGSFTWTWFECYNIPWQSWTQPCR